MKTALWILAVMMLVLIALQQIDLRQRNRTLREAAALTDRVIADNLALMHEIAKLRATAPPPTASLPCSAPQGCGWIWLPLPWGESGDDLGPGVKSRVRSRTD
ncbi:MAG TPA: hypothetical protein VGR84_19095 [Candidatus Acidoferrales bacterium]|nr:hypothetical protein [Candidatus Acidoferrales bacterium]